MAIEDIFKALENQADAECEEILDKAKKQAQAIQAEADEKAEEIRAKRLSEVDEALKAKTAQVINSARLQNKKDVAALKEREIDAIFASAIDLLAKLRRSKDYETLMAKLAKEACPNGADAVEIHVAPADAEVAEELAASMSAGYKVVGDLDCCGGLTAVYGGGRISSRNTFEDRLSKVRQVAHSQVAEILFE